MTIDDSVFKTAPELTLLQFVQYDARQVVWTDSIISTTITENDPCGPYIHELKDVSSGAEVALDSTVFTYYTS